MTFSLLVEFILSGLLAATLGCCALLERRLSSLRNGQDGLKDTIVELNGGLVSAASAMLALKEAASSAAESLDGRIGRARLLADELSLLAASGERIAQRIESRAAPRAAANRSDFAGSAVLANRLETLKPEALRNVR